MSVRDLQNSAPTVREPFLTVRVNGAVLTGVREAEVTSTSHFSADTFRLTCAVGGLPVDKGVTYWDRSDRDLVDIEFGFKGTWDTFRFTGIVDDVDFDIARGTLLLTGRDLSGDIIDTKTAEHFPDHSASAIVTKVAHRHGLDADVTDTVQWVGKIYEQMHVRLTRDQSEWDLLMFLAQQEGFDLWVGGKTLFFHPPVAQTDDAYVLNWQEISRSGNFENLKLKRSQTLAKDVIVRVRSWNQAQGKTFTAQVKVTKAFKSQRSGGLAQIYSFNVPNLDQTQADAWAKAKAAEITKHERVIEATLPGDNLLNNRSLMKLYATGTSWDQVYYVDTITRHISVEGGYVMDVRAKNHSTERTVNI